MSKPSARRATARPILPKPTTPRVLPWMSAPRSSVNSHCFHLPSRTWRSPSSTRRAVAMSRAQAKSAVVSVSTSGVLVMTTPRRVAAATSTLLNPKVGAGGEEVVVDDVGDQADEPLTPAEPGHEFLATERVAPGVKIHPGSGARQLNGLVRQGVRDEDGRATGSI